MSAPVDVGRFEPGAVPSGIPTLDLTALFPRQTDDQTFALPGDDGNNSSRHRSSSIDSLSKMRNRRSLSPRPGNPWDRPVQQRDRAKTFDPHSTRHGSAGGHNTLSVENALAGLARNRAWSEAAAGMNRWSGGRGAGAGAGGPHVVGESAVTANALHRPSSASAAQRAPLKEGQIELYVTPTVQEDLDALFRFEEPGSAAWKQVPLRHRNLPYSFFEETASLGGGSIGEGHAGLTRSVLDMVAETETPRAGGHLTPMGDFPSPSNLDALLGTTPTAAPAGATRFTYPDPPSAVAAAAASGLTSVVSASSVTMATSSSASMMTAGVDVIDEIILSGDASGTAPSHTMPGMGDMPEPSPGFLTPQQQAEVSTDAMDAEFLSNLDLDF